MFVFKHECPRHSRATGRTVIALFITALVYLVNGDVDESRGDSLTHASVGSLLETEMSGENGAEDGGRVERQGMCVRYDSAMACLACSSATNIRVVACCLDLNVYSSCENLLLNREDNLIGEGDQGNDWDNEEDNETEGGEQDQDMQEDDQMNIEEAKRRSPFLGKRRSPFLGKRRAPFLGKRRSPFLGKRRSPFLGKRSGGTPYYTTEYKRARSAFLGKRRSPFLGKRSFFYPGGLSEYDLADQRSNLQ